MKKLAIVCLGFLLLVSATGAWAATQTMSACSQAAFTTAYNAASSGDTIQFPAGSCNVSWSSSTALGKTNLTIQGRGVGTTSITSSGTGIFTMSGQTADGLHVTGIEFVGCSPCFYFGGGPQGTKNFRIDHSKSSTTGIFVQTNAKVMGVVDHNELINSYAFYLFFDGNSTQTYPMAVGNKISSSDNVLFIEDNTFTANSGCPTHSIVGNLAARAVIRYNIFDYSGNNSCGWPNIIDAHDSYENWPNRGTLGYEIYNNQFKLKSGMDMVTNMRGGQHIIYNNYINVDLSWPFIIQSYNGNSNIHCSGNTWDVEDASSTSCMDQPNHTYYWNNKENCGTDLANCTSGSTFAPTNDTSSKVILNTYYFTSAMPGYTAYTYPHPLASGTETKKLSPPSVRQP